MADYLIERFKRETRLKTIQQSGYLIVKGLLKKKGGNGLFDALDELFDIPKQVVKPQKSEEELISEFEDYIKGA
ncbi:MAG: hypothetical protein IKW45_06695 [Clostridia bacterium]|nr:hypothetical protein [Clostridia bacterium]